MDNSMEINLKGRHFLKLLDFTPEEINYLIELAVQLKKRRKKAVKFRDLEAEILLLFLKNLRRGHAVPLRWRLLIREHMSLTSGPRAAR